jgi:hypothetical protein
MIIVTRTVGNTAPETLTSESFRKMKQADVASAAMKVPCLVLDTLFLGNFAHISFKSGSKVVETTSLETLFPSTAMAT